MRADPCSLTPTSLQVGNLEKTYPGFSPRWVVHSTDVLNSRRPPGHLRWKPLFGACANHPRTMAPLRRRDLWKILSSNRVPSLEGLAFFSRTSGLFRVAGLSNLRAKREGADGVVESIRNQASRAPKSDGRNVHAPSWMHAAGHAPCGVWLCWQVPSGDSSPYRSLILVFDAFRSLHIQDTQRTSRFSAIRNC